jgi:predicted RNA binding protein YcfA (HicA-like mRNA interferase family)
MPGLRVLSAHEIRKFLERHKFSLRRQKGSHLIFGRQSQGISETMTVPNHRTLDRGTCHGVFKEAKKYIPLNEVTNFFYKK